MNRVHNFALIFLICMSGCSVFESVETKEYAMTWKVDRKQNNKGHNLVEFEFVDFPGHVIGHFSNDLIKYLEEKGEREVFVEIEITSDVFGEVIGLTFPNDTEPVGYYFLGSGIDRALVLKVMIADDQKEEVFKNEIFEKGNDAKSNHTIAKQQEWWKVDELTERIDRKIELPKAEYLESTVGLEDGKTYLYVK